MFKALKPYSFLIVTIALLSTAANGLSLYFPKKIGEYIDAYNAGGADLGNAILILGGLAAIILVLTLVQAWVGVYASEKVALDLRNKLIGSLKKRSFTYMRQMAGGRLITVMTSDVDAIKTLIASGIGAMLMAIVTLIGVIIFLLVINLKLALVTMAVMPLILIVFMVVFKKLGPIFEDTQLNLDSINKVINESIVASPLIRVLNARLDEVKKFDVVNKIGADMAMKQVIIFAALLPIIMLLSEAAVLIVLWFGGMGVMEGTLTIGEMSAFFSYTSLFVWPFFVFGFSSTYISKAQVSFGRINEVLDGEAEVMKVTKNPSAPVSLKGHIVFKKVALRYGEKEVLRNISFEIQPRTRTAIIGPTGAGKTELLYLMTGLASASEGEITLDGMPIQEWNQTELLSKIGMVFQDSILFNTTFKENVLFKSNANDAHLASALQVAELDALVKDLPDGLETNISERGINLSGGQKQRLMLARALAINPSLLLLDDFTSRVDAGTEERILTNLTEKFKDLTLISITQKIEPIKDYDHIIVLMEGDLIAEGTHEELLQKSLEYRQIYESQQSTEH
jgi:ATP-binding cassette subfamily B protein